MRNTCLSITMIFVLSFQIKGQNSYVKYQTFDEYKMEGIKDEKIKRPYVLVKKEFDTISVIKSNDKEKTIKYINRGNYWHTVLQIKEKWFFLETICEKFIYNDTVIEYKYQYKHPIDYFSDSLKRCNQRSNCGIYVHTKNNCLDLVIQNSDITNYDAPFKEIKEFVINYKEIFPLYSSKYQPRYYSIFEKHIEQNILSIYELDGDNKKFVASKKMNSLGEFDNKGILMWW